MCIGYKLISVIHVYITSHGFSGSKCSSGCSLHFLRVLMHIFERFVRDSCESCMVSGSLYPRLSSSKLVLFTVTRCELDK